MRKGIVSVFLMVAALSFVSVPEASAKDQTWAVRLGALGQVKPGGNGMFTFGAANEYAFGGPLWFEWGTRFAVDGDAMFIAVQLGLLGKVAFGAWVPTFRLDFMFDNVIPFEFVSNGYQYSLGGAFGPGLRYDFGGRAVFVDVTFEVARWLRGTKPLYFAIVPTAGFQF